METTLDTEFSPVRQRRADAGLGWLTGAPEALPPPLEEMSLGAFEPDVWLPPSHPAASRRVIGPGELARMDVIHGPRRLSTGTYNAWLAVMRECNPRFGFTDPPFRPSLPMTLAFVATASRPTAILTGPQHRTGDRPSWIRLLAPTAWSAPASKDRRSPPSPDWYGAATCRASSSRCSSTPPTASPCDPSADGHLYRSLPKLGVLSPAQLRTILADIQPGGA
jgi:DNA-binding transcriptional LysR family regulator